MSQPTILLIAANGQVGWELHRCLQTLGRVIPLTRQPNEYGQLDLTDSEAIRQALHHFKPQVILNAAAYTAVDKAEQEQTLAHQINGNAPTILAEEAKQLQALLVHYSTDYVFDGTGPRPYSEDDPVSPIGVYGRSKLAGEQGIQASGCNYLIFRTAWVYGLRGRNFLLTMQRLGRERGELKVVNDQIGAPTWSRLIAQTTVQILSQVLSPHCQTDWQKLSGIYHLTTAGETSWYEFAKAILAHASQQPHIAPITTAEYPTPAKRPAYSVLSNQKILQQFGLGLPDWQEALTLCLAEQQELQ